MNKLHKKSTQTNKYWYWTKFFLKALSPFYLKPKHPVEIFANIMAVVIIGGVILYTIYSSLSIYIPLGNKTPYTYEIVEELDKMNKTLERIEALFVN